MKKDGFGFIKGGSLGFHRDLTRFHQKAEKERTEWISIPFSLFVIYRNFRICITNASGRSLFSPIRASPIEARVCFVCCIIQQLERLQFVSRLQGVRRS